MKRFISIILCVLTLLSVTRLSAILYEAVDNKEKTVTLEDWQYTIDDNGNAKIKKYIGSDKKLKIPCELNTASVTSIDCAAFYNSNIENITIPDTLKEIGWWAFYGCKKLDTVNIENGLKTIGYGAFMNCPKLCSIEIPASVSYIGEDAFAVSCAVKKNVNDAYSNSIISTQDYKVNTSFKITGFGGTYAEKYSRDNSLNFNSIGSLLYGDVDKDGIIDNKDIKLIRAYFLGTAKLDEIQLCSADVDNDSKVSYKDIYYIKKYIDNKISYNLFPSTEKLFSTRNCLTGKSMYCDGDSIAKGTGTDINGNSLYSYCHYIAEKYNMKMENNAVGGTTIAKRKGYKNSILERVQNMKGSYDVILLDGGFNDLIHKAEIGSITDINDKSGNYNEYTTAGALESICYFLQKNYKDSIKLFVLCHKRNSNPDQYKIWELLRQILDKWEIDYIDLSTETQFCDVNEEITTQYFKFNNGKGDGLHPLRYANEKIYGPYISERLNKIAYDKLYANNVSVYGDFLEMEMTILSEQIIGSFQNIFISLPMLSN